MYASEIWGPQILALANHDVMHHLNKTSRLTAQIKIVKSILEVPKKTSNIGALAELGIYPIYIDIAIQVLKFYLRISTMNQSRLVYNAFLEDCSLASLNPTKVYIAETARKIITSPSKNYYFIKKVHIRSICIYQIEAPGKGNMHGDNLA